MSGRRETDLPQLEFPRAEKVAAITPYGHAMSIVLGALLAVVGVLVYFHFKSEPAPTGVHEIATPAPELAKVATEFVGFAPIKVFAAESKKRLNLPKSTQEDIHAHVIASNKLENDERQHTVTTVINDQTGEPTTYDRVDPLPWLAVKTTSQVGLYYGVKDGQQTIRIQGEQELLQIKAAHVGLIASADLQAGKVDTFAGVGVWVRW